MCELFVIERHGRTAARRAPADEADRSVDGNPVKPGVCMVVLFQARQSAPDLKQDFLIQVVPVGGVPRINTAHLENPGAVPVDQIQKLLFVWRWIQCPEPLLISRNGKKDYYAMERFLAGRQFVEVNVARINECLSMP